MPACSTDRNRLSYSKKGYIDGEISVEWLKDWDAYTQAKAAGRRRLLLVDGHASHYTLAFLRYARAHNIEVVGYPSHSTHVYQGLDVVIFGRFKTVWSEVRDRYEREGTVVSKSNFLAVYAEAHLKTLTEANIKAAFRKTGVIPLNRDVVTADMMAPSLESSSHAALPIQQSSPVKLMTGMITDYLDYQRLQTMPMDMDTPSADPSSSPPAPFFMRAPIAGLSTASASFLTSSSPLQSTSAPPGFKSYTISPIKNESRYSHLLNRTPQTAQEAELMFGTSKRLHPGFDSLEVYWVVYHQNSTLSPISDDISRRRSPQCSGPVRRNLGK
jgi:hypothetical protein